MISSCSGDDELLELEWTHVVCCSPLFRFDGEEEDDCFLSSVFRKELNGATTVSVMTASSTIVLLLDVIEASICKLISPTSVKDEVEEGGVDGAFLGGEVVLCLASKI